MANGYVYLIRRNRTALRVLAPAAVARFTRDPDPLAVVADQDVARGVAAAAKAAVMGWELYAEPGTVDDILRGWAARGAKLPVGRYAPAVRVAPGGGRAVSRPFSPGGGL